MRSAGMVGAERVKEHSRGWTFTTNADKRGGNVRVDVDDVFGAVTSLWHAPR